MGRICSQATVQEQDETGMREMKQKAWLWTMTGGLVAVLQINRSRGSSVARDMLQNVTGVAIAIATTPTIGLLGETGSFAGLT